jgi:transcriptional regulator with XRE-family HTH domain
MAQANASIPRLTACHLAHIIFRMVDVPNGPRAFSAALAAELRAEMERQGITGLELAARSRVDPSSISRWSRGRREMSAETIRSVAHGLGLTAEELVARAEAALARAEPHEATDKGIEADQPPDPPPDPDQPAPASKRDASRREHRQ